MSSEQAPRAAPSLVAAAGESAAAATPKPGTDNALPTMLPTPGAAAPPALTPATANAPAAPPFEARIAATVDSPAFAPALATQVSWLVREGVQHARLSLNPAEMGPLAVKIVLDGTQARVDFSADLAATRNVIEASLPSLAAALHDSGLTLAGGSVFDGQARHGAQGERSDRGAHRAPLAGAAAAPSGEAVTAMPIRAARGLVDLVA
jgi:flagellar hook-length control protein FliK